MSTPRPMIDTELSEGLASLNALRKRHFEKRMPVLTPKERRRMSYVVSKYRKKQMALLDGEYVSDPDPFCPTYVFYCFQGVLED